MLAAMVEGKPRGYLDLIKPFVLYCLPRTVGEQFTSESISKKMQELGFEDFPQKFTEKLLIRIASQKGEYAQLISCIRENGNTKFSLIKAYNCSQFEQSRTRMREQIEKIIEELQKFLIDNYCLREEPKDTLKEAVFLFFEKHGLSVKKNIDDLRTVTDREGKLSFAIAQFILKEEAKKSVIFEYLCNLSSGFLTYKALYIVGEGANQLSPKLKDVTFFLDCSLVLDALGYDTESDYSAICELIRLIRRAGGKVAVFHHTIDEASNLVTAFANSQGRRNDFRLDGLAKKNLTRELIIAIAQELDIILATSDLKIPSVETPSFSEKSNYANVLGETAIIDWLSANRPLVTGGQASRRERHQFDSKSLLAIGMKRRGNHPIRIDYAKAVLVTQDVWLGKCLESLYGDTLKSEFPFTISDSDLVSFLWLREFDKLSDLPRDILVANAYAACAPDPQVIHRAIEIADRLEKSGELDPSKALLIRAQTDLKPIIADITQNDINNVSEKTIDESISRYWDVREKQLISDMQSQAREELDALNKKYKEETERQRRETEALNKKLKKITFQAKVNKSEKAASRAARCCDILHWVIVVIFVSAFVIGSIIGVIKSICSNTIDFWTILYALAGVASFAITVVSALKKDSFLRRLIKKAHDNVYMKAYSRIFNKPDEPAEE